MSDYLRSLVAKNLSAHDNIRPLPRSRFEPPSPSLIDVSQAELAPLDEPRPEASSSLSSSSQFEPDTIPIVGVQVSTKSNPLTDLPVTEPYRGRLDSPSTTPFVSEKESVRNYEPPSTSSLIISKPSDAAQVPESVLERTIETAFVPDAKPAILALTALTISNSHESRRLANPNPGSVFMELRPVVPSLPDLVAPKAVPEPAPTINVTIGRIEVRATSSVTPPRRQSPQPKIMSLDEYLHTGSNRDRR